MTFQVVDCNQRLICSGRQGFGCDQPNHYTADQPRPRRCGNRIDLVQSDACIPQSSRDDLINQLDMGPGCDFGDNASIRAVLFQLAEHHVREDFAGTGWKAPDHRGGRFITTRFQSQDC